MILKIYIGTIIFYIICSTIFVIDVYMKLRAEGLTKAYSHLSGNKVILRVLLIGLIPVMNVISGLIVIFSKQISNIVDKGIEKLKKDYRWYE